MRTFYLIVFIAALLLCFAVSNVVAKRKFKPTYTGADTCEKCHRKTHRSWKKTKMAKAFDILKPNNRNEAKMKAGLDPKQDYTKEEKCIPCHTTGYGLPGGFVSEEETPKLVGVQCESCHGPGKYCVPIMEKRGRIYELHELLEAGLRPRPETVCITCHNAKSPTLTPEIEKSFDIEKKRLSLHKPPKLMYHPYKEGEKEEMIKEYENKKKGN